MNDNTNGVFLPGLVTSVHQIVYDFEQRVGVVYMPPSCCTDMDGAIQFFKRIDPKVRQIQTIAA
jgi:hypothetical protein